MVRDTRLQTPSSLESKSGAHGVELREEGIRFPDELALCPQDL